MLRTLAAAAGLVLLAGCEVPEENSASPAEVSQAAYQHAGPPALTLYTVINNYSGAGAHSALMVNADQRAIYDPAGTFYHPHLPEVGDVHYGMSPPAVDFYIDYHARESFRVIEQTIPVTPRQAAIAMAEIQRYGAAPKAHCTVSVASILSRVPGFEDTPSTWFPKKLMEAVSDRPGVMVREVRDDSKDDNSGLLQAPALLHQRQKTQSPT